MWKFNFNRKKAKLEDLKFRFASKKLDNNNNRNEFKLGRLSLALLTCTIVLFKAKTKLQWKIKF